MYVIGIHNTTILSLSERKYFILYCWLYKYLLKDGLPSFLSYQVSLGWERAIHTNTN